MRVKLLPPSSTELPAFNPIRSPAAVTQILLLANPHKVPDHKMLPQNIHSGFNKRCLRLSVEADVKQCPLASYSRRKYVYGTS